MCLDGERLAEQMRKAQIECEYADHQYVVLMGTPENTEQDLARIEHFARTFDRIQKVELGQQMPEHLGRYLHPLCEENAKETVPEAVTRISRNRSIAGRRTYLRSRDGVVSAGSTDCRMWRNHYAEHDSAV